MSLRDAPLEDSMKRDTRSEVITRLHGYRLVIVRLICLSLCVLSWDFLSPASRRTLRLSTCSALVQPPLAMRVGSLRLVTCDEFKNWAPALTVDIAPR